MPYSSLSPEEEAARKLESLKARCLQISKRLGAKKVEFDAAARALAALSRLMQAHYPEKNALSCDLPVRVHVQWNRVLGIAKGVDDLRNIQGRIAFGIRNDDALYAHFDTEDDAIWFNMRY